MIEQDTIRLLRECDAGVKMGIASIDDVMDDVKSDSLRQYLGNCRNEHIELGKEINTLLENTSVFFQAKKYFYVLHKTQTFKLVKSARKNLKKRCLLTALG